MESTSPFLQNWARNVGFAAERVERPRRVDQVQELVASSPRLGVVGATHSFNRLADSEGVLLDLEHLGAIRRVDGEAGTVTVDGGVRYHVLCRALHAAGFALPNLPSVPHFALVGACATGTHGSGDRVGGLHTTIREVEIVDGHGELRRVRQGDHDFGGVTVGLGAVGIVTALTLDVEPTYDVAQEVELEVPTATVLDRFDEVMAGAYSVSIFTDWQGDTVNQVWRKHRLDEGTAPDEPSAQLGGRRATGHLSPMGDDGTHTNTKQLLQPGPWHERLPHVATSHVLAPAGELHTEYFVRRSEARSALEAVAALSPVLAPVIRTSEIRTIAGDDAWLSPFRGDTVGLHFSWHIDAIGLPAVMVALEEALDPFEPVPHWGKLYTMEPSTIRARHPRFADFVDLAERLDPEHRFRNPHLDALLG